MLKLCLLLCCHIIPFIYYRTLKIIRMLFPSLVAISNLITNVVSLNNIFQPHHDNKTFVPRSSATLWPLSSALFAPMSPVRSWNAWFRRRSSRSEKKKTWISLADDSDDSHSTPPSKVVDGLWYGKCKVRWTIEGLGREWVFMGRENDMGTFTVDDLMCFIS